MNFNDMPINCIAADEPVRNWCSPCSNGNPDDCDTYAERPADYEGLTDALDTLAVTLIAGAANGRQASTRLDIIAAWVANQRRLLAQPIDLALIASEQAEEAADQLSFLDAAIGDNVFPVTRR